MKLALVLALMPLADAARGAAPSHGWFGGRSPLALVAKGSKDGVFNYATRDGKRDSATFRGEAPKGGTLLVDAAESAKDTAKDVEAKLKKERDELSAKLDAQLAKVKGSNPVEENLPNRVGPFWESKAVREGGLGFLFGAGTAACVRQANQGAAYALGGVCVAAQYISRSDYFGCGGKLGWAQLDDSLLRIGERNKSQALSRAGSNFKNTIKHSLPTIEGYILGFAAGLKIPPRS